MSRIDPAGKSAGEPYVNYAMRFSDVQPDIWYAEAIRWAAAEKIVSGFDAEHFAPDDPISREQLAVFLYRYSEYTGRDRDISDSGGLDRFADAGDISDWALDAVGWAVANGFSSACRMILSVHRRMPPALRPRRSSLVIFICETSLDRQSDLLIFVYAGVYRQPRQKPLTCVSFFGGLYEEGNQCNFIAAHGRLNASDDCSGG